MGEFSVTREAISRFSMAAARVLFPRRLKDVSDPMSGFFLVRRDAMICLSCSRAASRSCSRSSCATRVCAWPKSASSSVSVMPDRARPHSRRACATCRTCRTLRFGEDGFGHCSFMLTGASGVVVNSVLLFLATQVVGLHYLVSAVLATQGSSLWNFGLTEAWVFRGRKPEGRLGRFVAFLLMNNACAGLARADAVRADIVAGRALSRLEPDLARWC